MQCGAARGTNPCASPRAPRKRPGEMRVQVQVNAGAHPQRHPLPGAAGNALLGEPRPRPARGLRGSAGAQRSRKSWRLGGGGGGRPGRRRRRGRELGELVSDVETLVILWSLIKAARLQPGYRLFCLGWHKLCVNKHRLLSTSYFRA